ncbi:FecR family protein [Persicitalea sp.]|uniref:FecR family protein n=1 Tax=Persicitalea sp. TaxID=3100273 RepID=UPI00359311B6
MLDGETPIRTDGESRQLEDKIWRAIQQKQDVAQRPIHTHPAARRWWLSAAAAVVVLGLGWFTYLNLNSNSETILTSNGPAVSSPAGTLIRLNDTAQAMELTLSDGSRVTLAPRSSVEYPAKFESTRREVTLHGEALFQVTRNPQQPFYVNAGEVTTKVLGTSFRIQTGEENSSVQVSVLTGKVSVFQRDLPDAPTKDKIKNGVILTPNQRVLYSQASHSFETSLVEQPMVVAAESGASVASTSDVAFDFEDASMATVLGKLEKAYGIEIILENEELGNCLFTANITEQPLFTKLDLLCAALNSTYEVRGTKILIMGSGCR